MTEARHCTNCGASVRSVNDMKCPTCGNDNEKDAQFCEGCGASLSSARVAPRPGLPTVGFGEAISRGFTNYFTFSGRASRPEYWWWVLFTALVAIIPLSILVTFIPSLSLASRRFHDIGKSGWWQLSPWLIYFCISGMNGFVHLLVEVFLFDWYLDNLEFIGIVSALVAFLGFIATIVLLIVWMLRQGDEGPNKYGPDPRQPNSQQP